MPVFMVFCFVSPQREGIHMRMTLITCSAILLLVLPSLSLGVTTSCNIPSVEENQNTSLKCNFSSDIAELRRDFKVEFYFNNHTESSETILDCHWFNGVLECDVHTCCTFDRQVKNYIQVNVKHATKERVGKYVCFVLPVSVGSTEFCSFKLTHISVTEVPDQPQQEFHADSDSQVNSTAVVIIPILIIVVVLALVVVVGFILFRKSNRFRQKMRYCIGICYTTCGSVKRTPRDTNARENENTSQEEEEKGLLLQSSVSENQNMQRERQEYQEEKELPEHTVSENKETQMEGQENKKEEELSEHSVSENTETQLERQEYKEDEGLPEHSVSENTETQMERQEYKEDEGLPEHSLSENTETQIDVTSPVTSDGKENSRSISETENSETIPVQDQLANDSSVMNKESQNAEATGNTAVQEQSAYYAVK